jgi:hypothetical protein
MLAQEHRLFRAWAVTLGKFERAAMANLAKKGIMFYNTPDFEAAFNEVSLETFKCF